jgi:oxygen-independent coproporphyrinogen-3 oxidase
LPKNVEKLVLYQEALERLTAAGYVSVGMDHFSLPSDELAIAMKLGKLHRNFMGYTIQSTRASIGLGMSAISDSWTSYAQNTKSLEEYLESINKGLLPIVKGHFLTKKEMAIRKVILNLMCTYSTEIPEELSNEQYLSNVKKRLAELISDNLVSWNEKSVSVTSKGLPFIRNVCMAFDSDLMDFTYQKPLFSTTI